MKCDLCSRKSKRLLCDPCAEMIARAHSAHARIHKSEPCIAQQMAARAEAERKRAFDEAVRAEQVTMENK